MPAGDGRLERVVGRDGERPFTQRRIDLRLELRETWVVDDLDFERAAEVVADIDLPFGLVHRQFKGVIAERERLGRGRLTGRENVERRGALVDDDDVARFIHRERAG